MSFDSPTFWLFFACVWLAWRSLPLGAGKSLLLGASLVFYGWWKLAYLPLIVFSAGLDFVCARRIAAAPGARARRAWLVLSLCANLGLLAFFKYAPFALQNARGLSVLLGLPEPAPLAGWVVPVGISFYTFQSMSYTIDVHRRLVEPVASFRDFLLYVSFFPQLVAGPIVRAREFLPQLRARRALRPLAVQAGLFEIALGLFLKVVVADNLAPAVERVFDAPSVAGTTPATAWAAAFCFGGQIFADFAGYSAIAIGLARSMGFAFPENFRAPYAARSLSEFWRRWHVTLSSWLRDYLYIPLGGSRRGRARTYANLVLTMLLGGLWHGASWTFVLWGLAHGLGLACERALAPARAPSHALASALRWGAVLLFVQLAWVLFRARSLQRALELLERMLVAPWSEGMGALDPGLARPLVFLLPVALVHMARAGEERRARAWPAELRALVAALLVLALLVVARPSPSAFLYFQF